MLSPKASARSGSSCGARPTGIHEYDLFAGLVVVTARSRWSATARPPPVGRTPTRRSTTTGRAQAEAMAAAIGGDARPLFVSPLRRTRETAAALERLWGSTATVEPARRRSGGADDGSRRRACDGCAAFWAAPTPTPAPDYRAVARRRARHAARPARRRRRRDALRRHQRRDRQGVGRTIASRASPSTTARARPSRSIRRTDEWRVVELGAAAQTTS